MKAIFLMTTLALLTACQNEPSNTVQASNAISTSHRIAITQLHASNHCPNELKQAGIVKVDSLQHWNRLFTPKIQSSFPAKTAPIIDVDFDKQTVVIISRGQQANSAYSLSLNSPHAKLNDQTLLLDIELGEPDAEMSYAQMLIEPCLAVAFETNEDIKEISTTFGSLLYKEDLTN
jgi:hypothetical protein